MTKMKSDNPRPARSLAATLSTAFVTLSVVVLLISGGLQLVFNIQAQQQAISSEQQLIAQDASRTVSSFIQEKFSVLQTAVELVSPITGSPEDQKQVLDSLLRLQPAFRRLVLLNPQDQAVAQSSRFSLAAFGGLAEQLESDMLAQMRQENQYVSPVYIDDVTSEPMVILAVPVTNALGDFQGTLVAEVNLKFMWDLIDQLEVGETGYAYVVDNHGNLIAFRDTARVLRGENVASLSKIGEFVANPPASSSIVSETAVYIGLEGTRVVGTYVPLGTPQWAVVTELPWREAYGGVIQIAVTTVGVILVMALLAGLGGVFVARRLAVPLIDLTKTATQITGGDLELQAAVVGPSEIISLATAFNSMSASLRKMIIEENTSRVELEKTVDLYLAFVEKVTQGNLTPRLALDTNVDNLQASTRPLWVLGTNLNTMVDSLAQMTDRNIQLLAEMQLAKEKAEEANQVKSQFLASMSHELRTPLNGILAFSKYMRQGVFGEVNDQQVDYLNKMIGSGEHLLSLINDVLDVTKIQSGMLKLYLEKDFNVAQEIETIAASADKMLESRPVELILDIGQNIPTLTCDKRRMRQIIYNLVSNAIKFTEEGSITIKAEQQAGMLKFSVIDTGPGIAPESQKIIFDPFVQTETGIKHAGGTGLGLTISKQLAEAHGGQLWVKSKPGSGASFFVTLPFNGKSTEIDQEVTA